MIHFYYYQKDQRLVVSDIDPSKIKKKYGFNYEILNSIKDKEHVDLIIDRIMKGYKVSDKVVSFHKKKEFSEEYRRKLSEAKKGRKLDSAVKAKISSTMKGKSNFQGKKHSYESKRLIGAAQIGNSNVKDSNWVFDPRGTKELRIKDSNVPSGFSKGRDYYSIEGLLSKT